VAARQAQLATAALLVADLNLPLHTVEALIEQARRANVPLVLVAVSEPKMARLPQDLSGVRLLIVNAGELAARVGRPLDGDAALEAAMREVQAQGVRDVVVTRGADGVLVTVGDATGGTIERLQAPPADVVDVTGAGDAFAAGVCWSLVQGDSIGDSIGDGDLILACRRGLQLSALTLATGETVHPDLNAEHLAGAATHTDDTSFNEQD
jgi:pseudouridine kinase